MNYHVKSFDDGFGDSKGFDGTNETIIPSYEMKWQAMEEGEFAKAQYATPESHITVEYDGRKRLIGEAAQKSDKYGDWNGELNKHQSDQFIPLMKGHLALLCRDEPNREVHIDPLVMGLPINQDTPSRRQELANLVKGRHEVVVTLADGTVIDKDVHVDSIRFVSQPMGSFFNKVLNDSGKVVDEAIFNQTTVVIDVGARTLNLLFLNGLTPASHLSETKLLGVYGAWEGIQKDIQDRLDKSLPISRIPLYCETGIIAGNINIEAIRDENYADHANKILVSIGTKLSSSMGEVDNVIITGGGSLVLQEWLEKGVRKRFKKAKVESMGRTAAVRGYYNFGVRVAIQEAMNAKQDNIKQNTPTPSIKEDKAKVR